MESKPMTENKFKELVPFDANVLVDTCGYEVTFTALDVKNSSHYHRAIRYYTSEGSASGLWNIKEGCFNGYGETLALASEELNKIKTQLGEEELTQFRAFIAPCYD